MSYLLSGINVKNVFEYNPASSYVKYDIVDYQLVTGAERMPNFTGLGQTGMTTWFNNDSLTGFRTDSNFRITGWLNKVDGSGNLTNFSTTENVRPFIDFNEEYTTLKNAEFLTGTGFASPKRTIFLSVDVLAEQQGAALNIFKIGTGYAGTGNLRISGSNAQDFGASGPAGSFFWLDNTPLAACCQAYGTTNLLTLIQDTSTVQLRQNGFNIGQISSYNDFWKSGEFKIGGNVISAGINYNEIIHFTGVLPETEIDYYEKYLFERYVNKEGFYFAKRDVPVGEAYSPISFTGVNYWTKDIDDIFNLTYGCSANFSCKLAPLDFGDGYRTNTVNGVNSLNATFSLVYDGLTDIQAKSIVTYFENAPERPNKSVYEGFSGIVTNLFAPYKSNIELHLTEIDHDSTYADLNTVKITAEAIYPSILDHKGMHVVLDERFIKTYQSTLTQFAYNDVFYYDSSSFNDRGYYFYTGATLAASNTTPLSVENSPTGDSSYFTKDFYFKSDLDYNVSTKTRLFTTDFKNSTKEYQKDGINYNVLEIPFKATKRALPETRAILKYLDDKAGYKVFNYTLPQPYNKTIKVYCPEWSHSYDFYDNHNINAKFIEFKGLYSQDSVFNTVINFVPE